MPDPLADTIDQAAKDPKSVQVDGTKVDAHPLGDQIKADQYNQANVGIAKKHRGLRITKLVPPGA